MKLRSRLQNEHDESISDRDELEISQKSEVAVASDGKFLIANKPLSLQSLPKNVGIHELIGILDAVHILSFKDKLRFMSFPANKYHHSVYKSGPTGKISSKLFTVWQRETMSEVFGNWYCK